MAGSRHRCSLYSYYTSWLRTLGLSSSFLPKGTPQLLQIGFAPFYTYGLWTVAILIPLLWLLKILTQLLFRLVVVTVRKFMPVFYNESAKAFNSEGTISESVTPQKASSFSETLDFVINNLMFLFLLALVYGCLGAWVAFDKLEDIKNRKEIVYQLDDGELSILTCSSITFLCAVYNYNDRNTEIIKMESLANSVVVSKPDRLYERLFLKSADKKI